MSCRFLNLTRKEETGLCYQSVTFDLLRIAIPSYNYNIRCKPHHFYAPAHTDGPDAQRDKNVQVLWHIFYTHTVCMRKTVGSMGFLAKSDTNHHAQNSPGLGWIAYLRAVYYFQLCNRMAARKAEFCHILCLN